MEDLQLAINLLTATVIILTIIVVAVLAVLIVVLLKVRQIAKHISVVTGTVATAASYLHPLTWVNTIKSLIGRRR